MPVGSGGTPWGVSGPVRVLTPRSSGTAGQGPAALHEVRTDWGASWLLRVLRVMASETRVGRDARAPGSRSRRRRVALGRSGGVRRVLHEGGVVLAKGCPYCTRPRPSWSTPECRPLAPHPRAVADLRGALAGNGPLIKHRRQPRDGPGVQIGDKGSDRSRPDGTKPHDSKVSAHAVRGSGGPLSPIWTPSGRFPRCSEASHRQDRWRAVGNVRAGEGAVRVHLVNKYHMSDRNGANRRAVGALHGGSE